ncbi:MAG: DEAD/DEAH box helicase [Candidatus Aenigmarchaeota archaeon]|nr:DEAD/DEAH box helicase [Candidatus Aenigmarchaeota archaeon]
MERLKLFNYDAIKPRLYQELIASTAIRRNTLVVLPTGLGKTVIAALVVAYRLQKYPSSKALILAPTRPLCSQHQKTFQKLLRIDPEKVVLVTGKIKKEKRVDLYKKAKVVVSTPQCIKNDLERGVLSLKDFSVVVFDEAHRCVKNYDYTHVAKAYTQQALSPLILGLTASPGGNPERIEEIKKHLKIEAVEIRSESDPDVAPYVKKTKVEWVYVEFPEEFKKIKELLESVLEDRINFLKERGLVDKDVKFSELIKLSEILSESYYTTGERISGIALSMVAEAIKIDHAIELLETQGLTPLRIYFQNLKKQKSRASRRVLNDPRVVDAILLTERLWKEGKRHPKMTKLIAIIKDILRANNDGKIIVFANYRATINEIIKTLEKNGIKCKKLVGQAKKDIDKGLKQKEQIRVLNEFKLGVFNVLVASSVGEEGLDIPEVSAVIFYEAIPSELRRVQRRGRTGRTMPGRVIYLLTKGTRDEAYYWASFHRERKMKRVLYSLKRKSVKKSTIMDWLR